MVEEPDESLVDRYKKGDVAAFRTLYVRYRVGTFNLVLYLVKQRAAAEDLYQDVWISVTRAVLDWRPTGAFKSWLFQIARNRCLDHLKARRRSRLDDDDAAIESVPAEPVEPSDHRLRDALLSCLGKLNETQREVFVLRAVEKMTFAEITEMMASAPGLSNRRMQLAVEHMKRCLGAKGMLEDA